MMTRASPIYKPVSWLPRRLSRFRFKSWPSSSGIGPEEDNTGLKRVATREIAIYNLPACCCRGKVPVNSKDTQVLVELTLRRREKCGLTESGDATCMTIVTRMRRDM
jgi:hypothetical protein